jgi:hypothetical protein
MLAGNVVANDGNSLLLAIASCQSIVVACAATDYGSWQGERPDLGSGCGNIGSAARLSRACGVDSSACRSVCRSGTCCRITVVCVVMENWDVFIEFIDRLIWGFLCDFAGYSYSAGRYRPIVLLCVFSVIRCCCAWESRRSRGLDDWIRRIV